MAATEFTIRCGGYSIFTIFSQEAEPGWDSGQVPVCRDKNKLTLFPIQKCIQEQHSHNREQGMKQEVPASHKSDLSAVTAWRRIKNPTERVEAMWYSTAAQICLH